MVRELFEDFYLPIAGQVKIGEKGEERTTSRGTKYRAPVQLPYFLITTQEKEENSVVPDLDMMEYYGTVFGEDGSIEEGPTRLPIALAMPDFKESFDTFYAQYDKSRLVCKSDGETAYMYDEKAGDYVETACNPDVCQNLKSGRCKLHGSLYFYLRTGENFKDVQVGGVYVFRTTSKSTIYSLINSAYDIVRVSGDKNLAGLPLWLVYGRKTISTAEGLRQVPTISLRWSTDEYFYLSKLLNVRKVEDDEDMGETDEEEVCEVSEPTSILEEMVKQEASAEETPQGEEEPSQAEDENAELSAVRTRKSRSKRTSGTKASSNGEDTAVAGASGNQIPF